MGSRVGKEPTGRRAEKAPEKRKLLKGNFLSQIMAPSIAVNLIGRGIFLSLYPEEALFHNILQDAIPPR